MTCSNARIELSRRQAQLHRLDGWLAIGGTLVVFGLVILWMAR